MKKTIGLLAVMAATVFLGGCTLGSGNKDNINYNSTPSEERVEANAGVNDEVAVSTNAKALNIVAADSEAKYSLNEVLSGVPTLVVGTSRQLSGQIMVDTSVKPAVVTISDIQLDATSFTTDKPMRDKNVISLILRSDKPENKFIVFHPTNITGVPETLTADQSFPVTITGDLTISGITKPAIFNGQLTLKSDGSVTGTASTDLTYANFGLVIPNFPFLANVDQVVKLEVNLNAK